MMCMKIPHKFEYQIYTYVSRICIECSVSNITFIDIFIFLWNISLRNIDEK